MGMKSELPKDLASRLNNLFHDLRRNKSCYYSGQHSSHRGSGLSTWIFQSYTGDGDVVVIRTWRDKTDWKKHHFDVIGHDQNVIELIRPVIEQYSKDMETYYAKD